MKHKLREELIKLSTHIITSREDKALINLYHEAKEIYEKLAVLKFIDEKLNDVEVDISKNAVATRFEKMANAVMSGNAMVPENNPHKEDIITPGINTIKEMVSEMPSEALEYIFGDLVAKPNISSTDKESASLKPSPTEIVSKSLNDRLTKNLSIGLNDRLAFVEHLFNGNIEDYNRVISQLNTIESQERSEAFINNMVKPEYNNWAGKEDYKERFMAIVERKFA